MAYDAIEPLGDKRGDWQAAMVAACVMNAAVMLRTGRVSFSFQPSDFLLHFGSNKRSTPASAKKTPAQLFSAVKWIAALANADIRADELKKKKKR